MSEEKVIVGRWQASRGREVCANQSISQGDVLFQARPLAAALCFENLTSHCRWARHTKSFNILYLACLRCTFVRPSLLLCSDPCMCCTCTRFLSHTLSLSRSRALPFSLSHFRFFSRSLSRWTSFSRAHTYTHMCARTLSVCTCIHTRSYCFLPLEASPVHLPANRCGTL